MAHRGRAVGPGPCWVFRPGGGPAGGWVGSHTDENGTCKGYVNLEIDGGPFDSPLTPVSLVGTAATGAGLLALLRPLFRRVV